jgi:hypothetical protein
MNNIIVPARGHSHGAAKPKKGKKSQNGKVTNVHVNEGIWKAIWEVSRLQIGGRDFRTIVIYGTGKVEITNYGGT